MGKERIFDCLEPNNGNMPVCIVLIHAITLDCFAFNIPSPIDCKQM